jgi:integrase
MPKLVQELSALEVNRLRHGEIKGKNKTRKRDVGTPSVAYHAVGGVQGLILQCRPSKYNDSMGARSWLLRVTVGNRRREIGIGGYPDVTLAQAKEKAREIKEKIRMGIDPIAEKQVVKSELLLKQARAITFSQIANEYFSKKSKEFKTVKQISQLKSRLENYILPTLGNLLIIDIALADVEIVLNPIWEIKNETATRVRRDIERIIDLAGVKGLRTTDNPARWKGYLEQVLVNPKKVSKEQNQPALPVVHLPQFWKDLTKIETVGALALMFQILTAARPGAVRLATWDEFDLEKWIWTLPAHRQSAKVTKDHLVPLTKEAVSIITSIPRQGNYVFSITGNRPISDATVRGTLGRIHEHKVKVDKVGYVDPKQNNKRIVPHGFRSSFKDWAMEFTDYPDEVTELALSHVNSDKTRAAYARSQLIDKRRLLMDDWENYCLHGN